MRLVTVTSGNYLRQTVCMLESLRVWHPTLPVTVYALEQDWTDADVAALRPLAVTIEVLPESDRRSRDGTRGNNGAVYCVWKLDAFLAQTEPFLYIDGDTLVTRPLDEAFARVAERGWFTVNEGTALGRYHEGEITALVALPEAARGLPTFNTGVLGCAPPQHREVFALARQWARQIHGIHLGDQGLLNLAWFHLRGALPPSAGAQFNGGVGAAATVDLSHHILHFTGDEFWQYLRASGRARAQVQEAVWRAWPKGLATTRLVDTAFWHASLPHPWTWLNQCTQPRHKAHVAAMRQASLALRGTPNLLVRDAYEAHLLHADLLAELDAFWERTAPRFRGLRLAPTYHLRAQGRLQPRWQRRLCRWGRDLRARLAPPGRVQAR